MFYFFPQAVSKKNCKSIINRYLKKYKNKMKSGRVWAPDTGQHDNPKYRKTDVVFLEQEDEMYLMVNRYINSANDIFF